MNITILVEDAWLDQLGLADHLRSDAAEVMATCKRALAHALSSFLPDDALTQLGNGAGSGRTHRVMISLPSAQSSVLTALANSLGLTPGPTAKRLIGLVATGVLPLPTDQLLEPQVDKDHEMAKLSTLLGLAPRHAQAVLYDHIWESLTSGSFGLVEGSTGLGKTRAMMSAAGRWVRERDSNIGICAPSLAILRQFVQEHEVLAAVRPMPPLRLVIGRNEFVSEIELLGFLEVRGAQWDTPALREWMLQGRSPNAVDREESVDVSWQVHSLMDVAPDLPFDEVRLPDVCSMADRGLLAYRRQFGRDEDGEDRCILLFSHAMLAQDMRRRLIVAGQDETYLAIQKEYTDALRTVKGVRRKNADSEFEAIAILESELGVAFNSASEARGLLPPIAALLVDEGHTFEESISQSMSEYLSLAGLLRDFKVLKSLGVRISLDTIGRIEASLAQLVRAAPTVDKRDFVALDTDSEARLLPHLAAIASACLDVPRTRNDSGDKFRLALKIRRAGALLEMAIARGRRTSFLRHSPVRSLPQLFVSNANVQTILSRLWSSLESAAIVSATLYVPRAEGHSPTFISNLLRLPLDRVRPFDPVVARWLTTSVRGVWVTQPNGTWLYPPTANDPATGAMRTLDERELAETNWHRDLSSELERIWASAAGGVMVLCTSYATVQAVQQHLSQAPGRLPAGLVVASATTPLRQQMASFLRLREAGLRPLWLAVGAAWTGVDIGGHGPWQKLFGQELAPDVDNVVTDLVIPRLPYGMNQSLSHLWRMRNHSNMPWELFDAALRFKQAIGRLVRRAGLPENRRIFVLDARVGDPAQSDRLVVFSKSLAKYRRMDYCKGGELPAPTGPGEPS